MVTKNHCFKIIFNKQVNDQDPVMYQLRDVMVDIDMLYNCINFHGLRVWQNTKTSALVCVHRLDFWNVNVWVTSNQISCVFFGSPNLKMLGSVEATDCK